MGQTKGVVGPPSDEDEDNREEAGSRERRRRTSPSPSIASLLCQGIGNEIRFPEYPILLDGDLAPVAALTPRRVTSSHRFPMDFFLLPSIVAVPCEDKRKEEDAHGVRRRMRARSKERPKKSRPPRPPSLAPEPAVSKRWESRPSKPAAVRLQQERGTTNAAGEQQACLPTGADTSAQPAESRISHTRSCPRLCFLSFPPP